MSFSLRSGIVIPDLLIIESPTFEDERGFFHEYYRESDLEKMVGHPLHFVQANHSRSRQGVLRGIHAAMFEKCVYVIRGSAFLCFVDLRPKSQHFGAQEILEIDAEKRYSVYIPSGVGNSLYAKTEVDYVYLVSEYYNPKREYTIQWNDPDLAITWPTNSPIVSIRDSQQAQRVREIFPEKFSNA